MQSSIIVWLSVQRGFNPTVVHASKRNHAKGRPPGRDMHVINSNPKRVFEQANLLYQNNIAKFCKIELISPSGEVKFTTLLRITSSFFLSALWKTDF